MRFDPQIGLFAAIPDISPESLAGLGELVRAFGETYLFEPADLPPVPGTVLAGQAPAVQMIAERQIAPSKSPFEIIALTSAEAPEMLALATLTQPGPFTEVIVAAVEEATGRSPELSTTGGTSDARFIRSLCPVVEFGLVGSTMHQVDERVPVQEIRDLTKAYEALIRRYFEAFAV